MSYRGDSRKWRGLIRKLFRLSERIHAASMEVRYANKPYDLLFPYSNLIDLSRQIRDIGRDWLEWKMGLNPKNRGQWPHL